MKPSSEISSSEKVIIFDSSAIINFTMNGLLQEFRDLKKMFNGRFIITKPVKFEIVDKPLEIKKFELEALKIEELIQEGVLEMPESLGINTEEIDRMTREANDRANNTFFARGNPIHIVDLGESSCLMLSKILSREGIRNILCIDERTIRLLSEKPRNLLEILERKLHTKVKAKQENFKFFEGFKIIRTSELIFVAYKNGIIKLKSKLVLDALLYALKFHGCSISDEDIAEMKKLG